MDKQALTWTHWTQRKNNYCQLFKFWQFQFKIGTYKSSIVFFTRKPS